MKKTILTFGLISGAMSMLMMVITFRFIDKIGFDRGAVVGYTAIVLSFLLVFFGIRSYRENVGGGSISFGRAVAVGILIAFISSIFYVATWEVIYYWFMPDFCEKWTAYMIEKARAAGQNQLQISLIIEQMKNLKVLLNNPLTNAAMTFVEPFPVGLIITLISALILRKKRVVSADEVANESSNLSVA